MLGAEAAGELAGAAGDHQPEPPAQPGEWARPMLQLIGLLSVDMLDLDQLGHLWLIQCCMCADEETAEVSSGCQQLVEQMVSARVPDQLPSDGTHVAVRGDTQLSHSLHCHTTATATQLRGHLLWLGDGRCLIGATQHAARGYAAYVAIDRDDCGVPKNGSVANTEQDESAAALTR